jgi:hypothetical protein
MGEKEGRAKSVLPPQRSYCRETKGRIKMKEEKTHELP